MSALQPVKNTLVNGSLSRIPLMLLTRTPHGAPRASQRDQRDPEADGSRMAIATMKPDFVLSHSWCSSLLVVPPLGVLASWSSHLLMPPSSGAPTSWFSQTLMLPPPSAPKLWCSHLKAEQLPRSLSFHFHHMTLTNSILGEPLA